MHFIGEVKRKRVKNRNLSVIRTIEDLKRFIE